MAESVAGCLRDYISQLVIILSLVSVKSNKNIQTPWHVMLLYVWINSYVNQNATGGWSGLNRQKNGIDLESGHFYPNIFFFFINEGIPDKDLK